MSKMPYIYTATLFHFLKEYPGVGAMVQQRAVSRMSLGEDKFPTLTLGCSPPPVTQASGDRRPLVPAYTCTKSGNLK